METSCFCREGFTPDLGIDFYENLFKQLKQLYPDLKLHALGPPEIVHLSKLSKLSYHDALVRLMKAGLNSLPGAGAEILSDRVRKQLSKNKCSVNEWLDVMKDAHKLGLTTSATMMFGHIETLEERVDHLIFIRDVQAEIPFAAKGFIAFIPWPFQDEGTALKKRLGIKSTVSNEEYIRTIALCRIMLPNIDNIQASWLTVGKETAQVCLHAGANDFGSIMIEENVVSVAEALIVLIPMEYNRQFVKPVSFLNSGIRSTSLCELKFILSIRIVHIRMAEHRRFEIE